MTILQKTPLHDFDFWEGATYTTKYLSKDDFNTIEEILVFLHPNGIEKTALNNFFWFDADTIAQWLGFNDFEDLIPPWD